MVDVGFSAVMGWTEDEPEGTQVAPLLHDQTTPWRRFSGLFYTWGMSKVMADEKTPQNGNSEPVKVDDRQHLVTRSIAGPHVGPGIPS